MLGSSEMFEVHEAILYIYYNKKAIRGVAEEYNNKSVIFHSSILTSELEVSLQAEQQRLTQRD